MPDRRLPILLLWLAMLLAGLWLLQQRLQLDSDMHFFLPPAATPVQQLVLDELQQGAAARLLIVALQDGDRRQTAALSHQLSARLADEVAFVRVLNRPVELPEEEQQRWFAYRYLLQDPAGAFAAAALHESLQQRLAELASPLAPLVRQTLAEDPSAHFRDWLQGWQTQGTASLQHGVWFDEAGHALLLVHTRASAMALDKQAANLALIRQHLAALSGQAVVHIGGTAAIAVASRDTIRGEARRLSLLASALAALVLLWAWRSPRLWLLAALPLFSAILAGLVTTLLLFGQVHGITLAFGITLLGVVLDYPLHLFSQLRHGQPPAQALTVIWPRLRLGVASTLIGYLAMLGSGFPGLVQLGVFAASGLLAAALVTRLVLPAALPRCWRGNTPARYVLPGGPAWPHSLRYLLLLGIAVLAVSLLLASPRPLWQQELAALSPIPQPLRQQEYELAQALGLAESGRLLVIRAESAEAVLRRSESLRETLHSWQQEGRLRSFEMAAQLLPSAQRQQAYRDALPGASKLRQQLAEAQHGLPFRDGAFEPFLQAVQQSRQLTPLRPEAVQGTLLEARLAPLLFERQGQWWGLVRLHGVPDGRPLAEWAALQADSHYLDLPGEAGAMMAQLQAAVLGWLGWGVALIILLLRWGLGSFRAAWQVMLPVGTALLSTLATLHLLGELLSIFHLVALLLVLGIGLDYSLFFSHPGDPGLRRRTGQALQLCAISSLSVFVILSLSSLPVLQAIGLTVSVGIITSFLFAWLLSATRPDRQRP